MAFRVVRMVKQHNNLVVINDKVKQKQKLDKLGEPEYLWKLAASK